MCQVSYQWTPTDAFTEGTDTTATPTLSMTLNGIDEVYVTSKNIHQIRSSTGGVVSSKGVLAYPNLSRFYLLCYGLTEGLHEETSVPLGTSLVVS